MLSTIDFGHRAVRRPPRLVFAPLAWLKLQMFCHTGDTEIAGFGISAKTNLLYIEEFVTVKQRASSVTVALDDGAVADFMDRCVDAGVEPQCCMRVWCHTHPGSSPEPSYTDEDTFARVFGSCDWAVMFIVSRTGNTYARLSFHVGPGAHADLPVAVDWAAWADVLTDPKFSMAKQVADWRTEFNANIHPVEASLIPSTVAQDDANAVAARLKPYDQRFARQAPGDGLADVRQSVGTVRGRMGLERSRSRNLGGIRTPCSNLR